MFGLAFLFRLQSLVISGGGFPQALLKVDILNILGLSMVLVGALWPLAGSRKGRAVLFVGMAAAFAVLAPAIRSAGWLGTLPDSLKMYVRSFRGRSSFSLFPWPAFALVGAVVGASLSTAASADDERAMTRRVGAVGLALVLAGCAVSLPPPFFDPRAYWTEAPAYFLIRVGLLMAAIPVAFVWNQRRPDAWSPLREMGFASLFILDPRGDGLRPAGQRHQGRTVVRGSHNRLRDPGLRPLGAGPAQSVCCRPGAHREGPEPGRMNQGFGHERLVVVADPAGRQGEPLSVPPAAADAGRCFGVCKNGQRRADSHEKSEDTAGERVGVGRPIYNGSVNLSPRVPQGQASVFCGLRAFFGPNPVRFMRPVATIRLLADRLTSRRHGNRVCGISRTTAAVDEPSVRVPGSGRARTPFETTP